MERDNLVNRVEVLEKVKNLLLLPELEVATSKQVSEFYGVPIKSVNNVLLRNRDELLADGYEQVNGRDLALIKMKSTKKENKRGYILINNEIKIPYNEVGLFPKRAILRVGMLLRDSEVAKEVRTQLLNIEENTAAEVKTYEIDYEQEVLGRGFKVYGTAEEPLFLAKDVAEWIDYVWTSKTQSARDIPKMLKTVDEDEKLIGRLFLSGQNRKVWFLTEDGIYEILMQSRKPIAKQWKKEVELPEEGSSFVRSLQIYLVSYFET